MFKYLKICIIGDGFHSKRIQKILKLLKLDFHVYKPKSKKNFKKEDHSFLKNFNIVFIISPNETHYYYINLLHKSSYIFCEKPPTNNLSDLKKLKKINSSKIYYNFNYRFSKIADLLKMSGKFNLGNLIYANIISGKALAFKKNYKNNWRSNKKKCPTGVLEMLAIHWLDLIDHIFNIKIFNRRLLNNLSKIGNSFDNSNISVILNKNITAEIFCSYTSPTVDRKIFVFDNGLVEQNEKVVKIMGPSLNLDKNNLLKKPKLIKKFILNEEKDYNNSLLKSVKFFLDIARQNKNFSKIDNFKIMKINKSIL